MKAKLFAASGLLGLALASHLSLAQQRADQDQGRPLFDGSCARCHGFDGFGATGPNLQRSVVTKAGNEAALQAIIVNGIPTRGMPPTPGLSQDEMRSLVSYVQLLGRADVAERSVRAQRGQQIYNQLDCSSCHVVAGQGRSVGPELTRIGMNKKLEQLRQDLEEPGASLPRAGSVIQFLPVRVVARDGREISGTRINEDAFSIQLRDTGGQLHTFGKSELTRIDKYYDSSSMPKYSLDSAKMDDLVAYLSSLRGAT